MTWSTGRRNGHLRKTLLLLLLLPPHDESDVPCDLNRLCSLPLESESVFLQLGDKLVDAVVRRRCRVLLIVGVRGGPCPQVADE